MNPKNESFEGTPDLTSDDLDKVELSFDSILDTLNRAVHDTGTDAMDRLINSKMADPSSWPPALTLAIILRHNQDIMMGMDKRIKYLEEQWEGDSK